MENSVNGFRQRVYDLLRSIPHGRVVTYGRLAELLGDKQLARAVGMLCIPIPTETCILAIRWSTRGEN